MPWGEMRLLFISSLLLLLLSLSLLFLLSLVSSSHSSSSSTLLRCTDSLSNLRSLFLSRSSFSKFFCFCFFYSPLFPSITSSSTRRLPSFQVPLSLLQVWLGLPFPSSSNITPLRFSSFINTPPLRLFHFLHHHHCTFTHYFQRSLHTLQPHNSLPFAL